MKPRAGLPPLPKAMRHLPVEDRGYPVPWFVEWINGKPDFRVMNGQKLARAVKERRCWLCGTYFAPGEPYAFVIGPMCAINRISGEPPSHVACAMFAAKACPFLTLPKATRREAGLPEDRTHAGLMIMRNPGVTLVWITRSYECFPDPNKNPLFEVGEPIETHWLAEGRRATLDEVTESISSGLPILLDMAKQQGDDAVAFLMAAQERMQPYLPKPEVPA